MSARRRLRALRDDTGLTLIELMVAGLMFSILMLAALAALDTATKAERGQDARHQAMLEIRGAMDRFTKELRQATSIDPTSNHTMLKMKTLIAGVETQITYDLVDAGGGTYDFRRAVGAGAAVTLVKNMVTGTTPLGTPDPPFCYSYYSAGAPSQCIDATNAAGGRVPDALTAIRVTLAKAPESNPSEPITLGTDVQLRNV
jgi:Tfp pilus assembly protein PilE